MSQILQRRGAIAASGGVAAYSFPQNTAVLDNFNRADEGPPPTGWASLAGNLFVTSNQLSTNTGSTYGRWTATSFAADQEAWITVTTKGPDVALLLRYDAAANSGYFLELYDNAGTDTWYFSKVTTGSFVQLGAAITGPQITAGDKIGANAVGSTLALYVFSSGVWTQVGTRTDSTYTGTGYIGVWLSGAVPRLDNFGGGSIV